MNFSALQKDLESAIAADEKYQRENDAKFRAVEQKVPTYDDFRSIVVGSHLKPLDKKEKIVDPTLAQKNIIWNVMANKTEKKFPLHSNEKKHFTEMKNNE